jgi:hypothetical protein
MRFQPTASAQRTASTPIAPGYLAMARTIDLDALVQEIATEPSS